MEGACPLRRSYKGPPQELPYDYERSRVPVNSFPRQVLSEDASAVADEQGRLLWGGQLKVAVARRFANLQISGEEASAMNRKQVLWHRKLSCDCSLAIKQLRLQCNQRT